MLPETRKFKRMSILLACLSFVLAAVLAWLSAPRFIQGHSPHIPNDQDIIFPTKLFVNTKSFVAVRGTLTANWLGYKNNTYSLLCLPEQCTVASVEQIGPKQVGAIDGPVVYPVTRWTNDEVVAQDDALCSRITITFNRILETVLWLETPINQTEIACKSAPSVARKATIESSLFWRRSIPH